MDLNNLYNFKNAVRHFVDIDSLEYPDDVENFNTRENCAGQCQFHLMYKKGMANTEL